jgi:hypothetical protein
MKTCSPYVLAFCLINRRRSRESRLRHARAEPALSVAKGRPRYTESDSPTSIEAFRPLFSILEN